MAGPSDLTALNAGTLHYPLLMDFLQAMTSWTPTSIQGAALSRRTIQSGPVGLVRLSFRVGNVLRTSETGSLLVSLGGTRLVEIEALVSEGEND